MLILKCDITMLLIQISHPLKSEHRDDFIQDFLYDSSSAAVVGAGVMLIHFSVAD